MEKVDFPKVDISNVSFIGNQIFFYKSNFKNLF